MRPEVFDRAREACCYITVTLDGEVISAGTGFAFTGTGEVLTAAHVVTGQWPINPKHYTDPDQVVYCKFRNLPLMEYRVVFCGIDLRVPVFTGPAQIDLAVLVPKMPAPSAVQYLRARVVTPRLGDKVIMAGFSEELQLPFDVDRILEHDVPGAKEFRNAMRTGYMADMMGPLIKSGIIGNIVVASAENIQLSDRIDCQVMYIDNSMHRGASGGPVINEDGDVIGVLSFRAVARLDIAQERVDVPSGCTVAVGLAPLEFMMRRNAASAGKG